MRYFPEPVPRLFEELLAFLDRELRRISAALHDPDPTWDDMRFPATAVSVTGLSGVPGRDTTNGTWLFDDTTVETLWYVGQIPHKWVEGTDLKPHVHWMKTSSASGNVVWDLDYKWAPIGEVRDSSWTNLTSYTPSVSDGDTAEQHAITPLGIISASGKQISDMLIMKLRREAADGNDTFGGDAELLELDIHYQGTSGSDREYVKT